jgi:mannose-1-phosphate guanylyltransferase/phosphomannomutase
VFDVEIFKFIPENTFYDFAKNVFVELMEKKIPINTCICEGYWSDIGTIEQYRQSSFDILDGKVNIDVDGIENGVLIGDNTSVSQTAKLVSHNIIGNNCTIGENVRLEDCIIWDNVVIESNVKLKNVIVTNGIIRENTVAEDTVLSCSSGDKEYCKN